MNFTDINKENKLNMNNEYFIHNTYMADIGKTIINDAIPLKFGTSIKILDNVTYAEGCREIIGLYLLIPYLNNYNNQLHYDDKHRQITIFNDEYVAFKTLDGFEVTIKNLRDTMCHSFVSCDLKAGNIGEPVIIFDNRVIMSDRNEHENLPIDKKNEAKFVKASDVLEFLKDAYNEVYNKYNNNF